MEPELRVLHKYGAHLPARMHAFAVTAGFYAGDIAERAEDWCLDLTYAPDPGDALHLIPFIAIADPIGRIGVWVGRPVAGSRSQIVASTLEDPCIAKYWNRLETRGGPRCTRAFALAAARVRHATWFAYPPDARDVLLAPYAVRNRRPATPALLAASREVLEAADLLYAANAPELARKLVARHRRGARRVAPAQPSAKVRP